MDIVHMIDRPFSVCGSDQEALAALIRIHSPYASHILDCTYSKGTMWKGLTGKVFRTDLYPQKALDTQADCAALPLLDNTFDVIVFDPPHIADGGKNGLMHKRYGSNTGNNLHLLMDSFLGSAFRVLKPKGVILAKIANGVHAQRFMNWTSEFLWLADEYGFTQVDEMIRVRKNVVIDPKWKSVYHVKQSHVYWLAVQLGR